jgi:hypothetical protein
MRLRQTFSVSISEAEYIRFALYHSALHQAILTYM